MTLEINQTIGNRIKKRRLELGLSQDELAKRVGYVSRSSINKVELSRDLPLRKIESMSVTLGVSPAYLMGYENETCGTVTVDDRALDETIKKLEQIKKLMQEIESIRNETFKEANINE